MISTTTLKLLDRDFRVVFEEGGIISSDFVSPNSASIPGGLDFVSPQDAQKSTELHALQERIQEAINAYNKGSFLEIGLIPRSLGSSTTANFIAIAQNAIDSIPPGTVISYGKLADRSGNPKAHRAAARACSTNPIPIFRPCHRVIRSDGSLGGYAFGLEIKRDLLAHENYFRSN
ncbi:MULTISPECIES: MGMT family protein [Acidithrix]|uniref:methylated-DNA--[protein]-cysteine S-methyltransferase n=1 Tax=Acidithrix ferrooxidans TaxID=1280514 RepID=A0A0D8HJJ4_9ACTN|nr:MULTISPECIES: MGMT family protein [Acidithrix]KJF17261.1 methylated-DNA--protein-cysteine methyltransferase [Acidithrix ferrooxidans]CAG4929454.1 unnamed protein product [Acidithrix sp. C25]